jgi:CheY-specific phosphatase CheX
MITIYVDDIHKIAIHTFEVTCFMFPMEEWEIDEDVEPPCDTTRAIVEFDGAISGGMVINPSEMLLSSIAENMLGIDKPSIEQKKGALCEITNIICGNAAPLFAKNDKICVIKPPQIIDKNIDTNSYFKNMSYDIVNIYLDEGVAQITIYVGDNND